MLQAKSVSNVRRHKLVTIYQVNVLNIVVDGMVNIQLYKKKKKTLAENGGRKVIQKKRKKRKRLAEDGGRKIMPMKRRKRKRLAEDGGRKIMPKEKKEKKERGKVVWL